ncbi:PAS domain-containing sensor histidine kinase [Rhizobium sp. IBUN]|uniref:hybrid sensor histidine kinase/response regulator n=1 Tax=Rhizobium sp. IBUN TaxID=1042326 RepID=UPI000470C6DD|nr:PAS domain-containing sensor histidine kinase [Rhizobium sp. IBUN]
MSPEISPSSGAVQDRYRTSMDAISDYAIYMLDPNGYVSSWNTGANKFKGYMDDEIVGEHFSRFYTPEDQEAGLPARALHLATQEGRFEEEAWRVRKDGTRFWAHVVIDPLRDNGQVIGFAKITRDLSERKRAEEALRRSEEQFRLLVQGVTDYAIYMLSPKGFVSSWNVGAQRIKGYTPEEIIGQHFSRFYTDEDKAVNLPVRALEIAEREGRFEREGWRLRKDGSRFWANVIIDAIRSEGGELIGFAKVTRDITEKRQVEEALAKAQRGLFQAQKMEAVGQLTGGVAHDFNNLLMAILGSLEIAEKRAAAGQDVTGLIRNAIQGAKRGASLTQRLLAFSRKQELELQPVDIPDLVRGMTDMLRRSLGPIEINTNFPLGLPKVQCDPNQLENALVNLALNARDAISSDGEITIGAKRHSIAAGDRSELKPGNYICLSVTDNGEGMDEETLANATTPFFTTKGVGKGTGLGLSMVQGLLAQSGGRLILLSTKGEGTCAELWLPTAGGVDETAKANQAEEKIAPQSYNRPLNILVVDDDQLVLTNAVLLIEDLGHATTPAQSAEEALKILSENCNFDLVITDHAMPKTTGSQLAGMIEQKWPGLPVVLATGYADLPQGADRTVARLPKPYSQAQLAVAISQAVEP